VNARLITATSGDLARICRDHDLRVTVRLPSLGCEVDARVSPDRPIFREQSYWALSRKDAAQWAVVGAYRA
jgi:hypothetical protein